MLWENGPLSAIISNDELPPNPYIQLNTSNIFISQLAPSLSSQYPQKALRLIVNCDTSTSNTSEPSFTFIDGGIILTANVSINFQVLIPSPLDAFTLQLDLTVTLLTSIQNGTTDPSLQLNATDISLEWNLVESQFGEIHFSVLDTIDTFIVPTVLNKLNSFLGQNPVPLPTIFDNVQLTDISSLKFVIPTNGDSYVCISSNVVYIK
jgi:hypothetical protein